MLLGLLTRGVLMLATLFPVGREGAAAPSTKVRRDAFEDCVGRVLIVDDDEDVCEFLAQTIEGGGITAEWCMSPFQALERVESGSYDTILTDLQMVEMGGLELCERLHGFCPDVPVVVITGHGSLEHAVSAIRAGAYDFITKPVDSGLLRISVLRALQHRQLQNEVQRLRGESGEASSFSDIIGQSSALRSVFDLITRVADSEASVLICGESGTGKELVARALHARSARKGGPFLAINCAAVPDALIESELFGHTKGAFTDARAAHDGLFVAANGGTLFLDEIGELPMELQPKLLRALQERKVRPIGGNAEVPFNARIVAATNRDLETEVYEHRFREDLFYRINVVGITVPPLRSRGGDVLLLAQNFVERFAGRSGKPVKGISTAAAEKLMPYDWPGNVRELENCIERAVVLARYDQLTPEDLPERIRDHKNGRLLICADTPEELVTVEELERRYVLKVLAMVGGNKSRAAQVLGLDRRTLYRRLERYES
jgi:two-component system response regulator HydG